MRKSTIIAAIAIAVAAPAAAKECKTLQDAMARFNEIKVGYAKVAPTLKPEQFQVWTKHIKAFGGSMGKMDYAGACVALDAVSRDLGLEKTAAAGGGTGSTGGTGGGTGGTHGSGDGGTGRKISSSGGSGSGGGTGGGSGGGTGGGTGTTTVASGGGTPAAGRAGIPGVWMECPRGRCRR